MAKETHWQLSGATASLEGFGGQIDLAAPGRGLAGLSVGAKECPGPLLQLKPAGQGVGELCFLDAYVRGRDVIARYEPTQGFPFRTEVYWRIENEKRDSAPLRLSLIVSVETDLLDTYPELCVSSQPPGQSRPLFAGSDEKLTLNAEGFSAPTAVLSWPADQEPTWFEAVHPSDRLEAELEMGAEGRSHRWRLFSEFLEKGVIRRARLMAALVGEGDPTAAASESYHAFAQQAPPLTV